MAGRRGSEQLPSRRELCREVSGRLAAAGRDPSLPAVESVLHQLPAAASLRDDPSRARRLAVIITDDLSGLGPVGPLMRDPAVTEIMINSPRDVYVERAGRLERARVCFRCEADVLHLIERVVSPLGLRVDATAPWVDARLQDGSRLHAIVPPIAVAGPTVTIRKFSRQTWTLEDLIEQGCLTQPLACALAEAVRERRNLLICGGAGSGKTTLLGILARLVPAHERLITIEEAAELRLGDRHVAALETRPPTVEGKGEVTLRDLVRCAMRMRPDRIIVGEVRGPEALDMLQALNSGQAGSMATLHANSPRDALLRLEALATMAAQGMSVASARRQVASAIEIVVQTARMRDGARRVTDVAEVRLAAGGGPEVVSLRERGAS
jgi:pilus assembly protein CpaF